MLGWVGRRAEGKEETQAGGRTDGWVDRQGGRQGMPALVHGRAERGQGGAGLGASGQPWAGAEVGLLARGRGVVEGVEEGVGWGPGGAPGVRSQRWAAHAAWWAPWV